MHIHTVYIYPHIYVIKFKQNDQKVIDRTGLHSMGEISQYTLAYALGPSKTA